MQWKETGGCGGTQTDIADKISHDIADKIGQTSLTK
jgi:hypothetical protein